LGSPLTATNSLDPSWLSFIPRGRLPTAIVAIVAALSASSTVTLTFDEPQDEIRLFTDDKKVSQILRNFISNALKFTPTGEVRVSRMLGVFAAGRIVNPRLARSQFIGGMTMGISMALHEESVMDAAFGDYVNKDFAQYHIAACADIESIEAHWVDETDDELNPIGSKGIGEIGIVGTAAAVANAVFNATGKRVRDLPIRLDRVLGS